MEDNLTKVWDLEGNMHEVRPLNARDLCTHLGWYRKKPIVVERKGAEKTVTPVKTEEETFDPATFDLDQISTLSKDQCMAVAEAVFNTKLPKAMNKAEMQSRLMEMRDAFRAAERLEDDEQEDEDEEEVAEDDDELFDEEDEDEDED